MKPYLLVKIDSAGKRTITEIEAINDEAAFQIAENNFTEGLVKVGIFSYVGDLGRVSVVQRNVHDGSNESDRKAK